MLTSILIANGFSHNFEEILFLSFFIRKRFAYRCFNSIDIKSLKDSSLSLFGSFIGYIHIGNSDFGSIKVVISQYVDQLISENIIIIISIFKNLFSVRTTCLQVIRYSDLLQSYRSHYVQILQISQGPTITILYILQKVLIVKLKSWFEHEDFFHKYIMWQFTHNFKLKYRI